MTDTSRPDDLPPQEHDDLLAAEYVLGVLSDDDWRAAQARVETDGAFAARVHDWEARLTALDDAFEPVAPPPHLWPRIEERLFPAPRRQRQGVRGWLMGGVVAAGVVAALVLLPTQPDPLIARLQSDALVFEAVYDGDTLQIARDGPAAATDRDYELWAIGGDGVPRSLGILRGAQARVSSDLVAEGVTLAISLEPLGGSPGDAPTGPVLAVADLLPG